MIYHGRATLSTYGEDTMGNPVVGPSFEVRAEMRPVNSAETDAGASVVTQIIPIAEDTLSSVPVMMSSASAPPSTTSSCGHKPAWAPRRPPTTNRLNP